MTVPTSCYLCSPDQPAAASFPAAAFTVQGHRGTTQTAAQDWGACRVCAVMVIAGRWSDLATRCADAYLRRHPENPEDPRNLRVRISAVHQAFNAARNGPTVILPTPQRMP